MDFSNDKPIYSQIVEYCYHCIAQGFWPVETRVPSTRELAVSLEVNNRTVLKAFDDMAAAGIIYQRRGLGYFVAPDAHAIIHAERKKEFMTVTLPAFIKQMRFLGLSRDDIAPLLPDN